MAQYIVTANKLNKRSIVPSNLPDTNNIVATVNKGYTFNAQEAAATDVPNAALGKWYRDNEGYFYWGGGIAPLNADGSVQLTAAQVSAASGALAVNAQKFLPFIIDTCSQYFINTAVRQLCFLAQTGHESGGLFYTEELDSGEAYEWRESLGNTHAGDGVRYKGRGLIQITGRGNYQWLSNSFKVDFIANPQMLGGKNVNVSSPDQLKYSALSAGWYWDIHALNAIADKINIQQPIDTGDNLANFMLITRKINGGYNGLQHRISLYKAGVQYFK